MEKLEKVKVGSWVVLGTKEYWYMGTVTAMDSDTVFRFKVEDSYRFDLVGAVFYGNTDELDYVENA